MRVLVFWLYLLKIMVIIVHTIHMNYNKYKYDKPVLYIKQRNKYFLNNALYNTILQSFSIVAFYYCSSPV